MVEGSFRTSADIADYRYNRQHGLMRTRLWSIEAIKGCLAAMLPVSLLIITVACNPISRDEVIREAEVSAKVGMNVGQALEALKGVGFACGNNGPMYGIEGDLVCTRQGGSHNLAGCVQRVFIDLDRARRISRVHDPAVNCTGL
jgi:hypothetical protein